jgi:hypothetical protein
MGADIYLESVRNPWFAAFEASEEARGRPIIGDFKTVDDIKHAVERVYDAYRSSGGYFRNGYNSGDVMWAMGLSWTETVGAMLDANKERLPVDRARELVAMIEARPLTRERVARHFFEHMTDGVKPHPVTGPLVQLMQDEADKAMGISPQPMLPPDFDHLFAFLSKRREDLLAILRKSIALDEPLLCSL